MSQCVDIIVVDNSEPPVIVEDGSDGNAVYIRGIIVAQGTPSDGQVMQYQASTNSWVYASTGSAITVQKTGASTPVGSVTPDFTGQQFRNTSNGKLYIAMGTTSSDWKEVLISP